MDDVISVFRPTKPQPISGTYYVNCDLCGGEGCGLCANPHHDGNGIPREFDDDSGDDNTSCTSDSSTLNHSDNIDNDDDNKQGDDNNNDESKLSLQGEYQHNENVDVNLPKGNDFQTHNSSGFQRRWTQYRNEDASTDDRIKGQGAVSPTKIPKISVSQTDGSNTSNFTKERKRWKMSEIPPDCEAGVKKTSAPEQDCMDVEEENSSRGSNFQGDDVTVSGDMVAAGRNEGDLNNEVSSELSKDEGVQGVHGGQTYKPGLIRKSAVRRKGYNWTSKSMPKTGPCSLQLDNYVRKSTSLQTGSSLELAPSLLNLYDGIASPATELQDNISLSSGNQQQLCQSQHAPVSSFSSSSSSTTASPPSSLSLPQGEWSTVPSKVSPCSPNSPPAMSRVPYRSAKLPSLSQPMDRPVSLMDADSSSNLTQSDARLTVDSKKRPLSVSSASSVSTSSLPRIRKKRQNGNSSGCDNKESESDKTGCSCHNNNTSPSRESRHRIMCSRVVSESHSSMDSGCVENDHNGERCFDDTSITSSSEAGSIRDDMSSGIQDYVDTSQSSLGVENNSNISQSTPSTHTNDSELLARSNFSTPEEETTDVNNSSGLGEEEHITMRAKKQPTSSYDDSDVMKRMGSYIVRTTSPKSLRDSSSAGHTSDQDYLTDALRSIEERRRLDSISRNEARQRFFSNYEERYSQLYSTPKDTEPDYEMLTETTHQPSSSISHPTIDSISTESKDQTTPDGLPLSAAMMTSSISAAAMMTSSISAAATAAATTTIALPPSPTSPNVSSHSSSRRTSSSRSSKKRESGKSGESTPTPSSPVYITYVQRVVTEIVESERMYISSLEDIIFGYLEPLEGMLNMEAAKDDIVCLFSNIREIYHFGRIFLADLELTFGDPIKVAECFVHHNRGFVIYTEYCTNYPSAVEVLTRFMQHPELSELCKERQTALGHGLPLGAYLLRPVQRILKYHLLLQNIVKSYEKESKDVPVLKQAFQHMTEMAHHINEMKRKHEHAVRIQEIQSQLEDYSGEDLTRLGELVLESTFRIYGAKASRQVFLFERGLLISKKKDGGMLSCKTFIKCSNLMLVEVIPNEPLSFHAIPFNNPRAQYTLQARNMEQKRRWCQEIKRLILESFKGLIPDNVKSLVMELGREHDDDYVTKEALDAVRKHQHTAPEYLEKRRVRRKSGSRLPDFSLLKPHRAKRNGQRKEEKVNSRFFLDPVSRRAESKSPDSHRKLFSKLILPQPRSQSHSLPNTPITESMPLSPMLHASNCTTKKTTSQPSSPDKIHMLAASQSAVSNSIPATTSPSPPVSDLSCQSPIAPKTHSPLQNFNTNNPDHLSVVKRTPSFLVAVKAHPLSSQDLTDVNLEHTDESDISEISKKNVIHQQNHLKVFRSPDGRGSESSEDDDYVMIKEDDRSHGQLSSHSQQKPNDGHSVSVANKDTDLDSVTYSNVEKSDLRSSSLPLLLDEGESESVRNQYQSSDTINHSHVPRGRMSRRDLQNVTGNKRGRKKGNQNPSKNNSKEEQMTADTSERVDSDERLTCEKNPIQKTPLRIPNTSLYLNIPDRRTDQQTQSIKARLTDWNSVDKLTKGSMTNLSQIHEDPWVVNSQPHDSSTSDKSTGPLSSSLNTDSTSSNGFSSLQNLSSNSIVHDETLKNRESLDWLVYLKRNCLNSDVTSFINKPKRMSTSVLEGRNMTREIIDVDRRISVHSSPYATPPRFYMTQERMKKFAQSPNASKSFDKDFDMYCNSNQEHKQEMDLNLLPRWQSTPNTSDCSNMIKADRPYSLDLYRIPDEKQLRDESNRIVAEMEDYISNTSSSENIKSPNKFPTSLPIINIETNDEEENSNENKRLSTVSSISTSSYESTSSDGLVGTLKSKLHSWANQRTVKSEESGHSNNSTISSDEENDVENVKTLNSKSKPKNVFEPPSNQRKSWQEDRKLEKVLRERSLGSESLGSRMAHAGPTLSECSKSLPQLQTVPDISYNDIFSNNCHNVESNFLSEKVLPDNSRFSLPTTTEAAEALMTLTLDSCDIQQSDSGFSLQSNDSTLSDVGENLNSQVDLLQSDEKHSEQHLATELKSDVPEEKEKGKKLSRQNSSESVDSADSFYERRLSLAFNSDDFKDSLTIVNVYDDTALDSSQPTTPQPPRKSIREYVQMIEENTKPQSSTVFEVRKREPGTIIRQRLESLRKNVNYGRSKTCGPVSARNVSEEREFIRSKSQPPSQYRKQDVIVNKTKCNDDIEVKGLNISIHGKNDLSISRETMNSLSKPRERISSLSKPRERISSLSKPRERISSLSKSSELSNLSKSRDSLNLSKSRESLHSLSKSKESLNSFSLSLPRNSSTDVAYHSSMHGHEKDWMRYNQSVIDDDESFLKMTNQFVHRVKQDTSHPDGRILSTSSSVSTQEDLDAESQSEKQDQQSSEVDNLVIMKGWVRALITKFQEK